MAITKQQKAELISDFQTIAKDSSSIVFVSFKGMSVNDTIKMRKQFFKEDIGYRVTKKTLLKRALGEVTGEFPEALGEIAIAYGKDLLAPAREVLSFTKEYKGKVNILGGVYEGKFMNQSEMMEIATIPSREVLLSKIAYLLSSPMQRLAIGVSEVAKTK